MTIQPSVLQMLELGKGYGLNSLEEAYNNYMNHYDCFFLISDYHQQKLVFDREIIDLGFTLKNVASKQHTLLDMTIEKAIKQIKENTNGK